MRTALVQISSLEKDRQGYESAVAEVERGARALAAQIWSGLPAYFKRRKVSARADEQARAVPPMEGLTLSGAHLCIHGDSVEGWVVGTDGGAGGWRVEFSASCADPQAVEWALASELEQWPAACRQTYRVELAGEPTLKPPWGAWLDDLRRARRFEKQNHQIWSALPADFGLLWAHQMLEELSGMDRQIEGNALRALCAQMGDAIQRREIVIERETGGPEAGAGPEGEGRAGAPSAGYCAWLPSFDIHFNLAAEGRIRIERVDMRKRWLVWDRRERIYPRGAGGGADTLSF